MHDEEVIIQVCVDCVPQKAQKQQSAGQESCAITLYASRNTISSHCSTSIIVSLSSAHAHTPHLQDLMMPHYNVDRPCYDESMQHLTVDPIVHPHTSPQRVFQSDSSASIQHLLGRIATSMEDRDRATYTKGFTELTHRLVACFHMNADTVSALIVKNSATVASCAIYINEIICILEQMGHVVASAYVRKYDSCAIADDFNIRIHPYPAMRQRSSIIAAYIPGKELVAMLLHARSDYDTTKQYIHDRIQRYVPQATAIIDTLHGACYTFSLLLDALVLQLCSTFIIPPHLVQMLYHPSAAANINISEHVVIAAEVVGWGISTFPQQFVDNIFHHLNPNKQYLFATSCKMLFRLHRQHALRDTKILKETHGPLLTHYEQTVAAMTFMKRMY